MTGADGQVPADDAPHQAPSPSAGAEAGPWRPIPPASWPTSQLDWMVWICARLPKAGPDPAAGR